MLCVLPVVDLGLELGHRQVTESNFKVIPEWSSEMDLEGLSDIRINIK